MSEAGKLQELSEAMDGDVSEGQFRRKSDIRDMSAPGKPYTRAERVDLHFQRMLSAINHAIQDNEDIVLADSATEKKIKQQYHEAWMEIDKVLRKYVDKIHKFL